MVRLRENGGTPETISSSRERTVADFVLLLAGAHCHMYPRGVELNMIPPFGRERVLDMYENSEDPSCRNLMKKTTGEKEGGYTVVKGGERSKNLLIGHGGPKSPLLVLWS